MAAAAPDQPIDTSGTLAILTGMSGDPALIESLELLADRLQVTWTDGATSTYPWLWLRENGHDEQTLHPVTQQRLVWTAGLDPATRPLSAEHGVAHDANADSTADHSVVTVRWSDGTSSGLPIGFLRTFRIPAAPTARLDIERQLWDANSIVPHPTIAYAEVMASDDGVVAWLRLIATFGFAIVTDTPATADATAELLARVSYVRETIFGGFGEFTADLNKADTAYTTLELLPHTDGTYSHDAPGLQLLHCLEFDGTGGVSTMVDGFRIAHELQTHAPEHFALLASVAVAGQYIGDGSHLMAARPVFRHDHTGELVQVSFNNSDRAPFLLPHDEMIAWYEAMRAFDLMANDPANQWRHVLRPGEAMLFDNWRVLHGRTAYTGRRRMCSAYLNHEDFESRLRLGHPSLPASSLANA